MQSIIQCRDIYKSFNGGMSKKKEAVRALIDVNFNVKSGECFGLI